MADNNVTPFPANYVDLLLHIKDKVNAIENKLDNQQQPLREPIQVVNQVVNHAIEPPKDKWLDVNNRPKPNYTLKPEGNTRSRFTVACVNLVGFFEKHYIPEIGKEYNPADKDGFMHLLKAILKHLDNHNHSEYAKLKQELINIYTKR